jgi:hypothetical protein
MVTRPPFIAFLVAAARLILRGDAMRRIVVTSATVLIAVGLVLLKPAIGVDGLGMLTVFVGLW